MSFSNDVKNEVAKEEIEPLESALYELAGMVRHNGTISLTRSGFTVHFITENNPVARRTYSLIKRLFQYDAIIEIRKNTQLRKKNTYRIHIEDVEVAEHFLLEAGYDVDRFQYLQAGDFLNRLSTASKKVAFLRGAFFGGGSITNPDRMYHLEIVSADVEAQELVRKAMNQLQVPPKQTIRKDQRIVYLKDSELITDFLALIGAHQSLLKFEDIRAMKDIRNNVNRVVNCETANLDKTITASMRQRQAIAVLERSLGLENLPDTLREIALVRLENEDLSLKELGELLDPPIGKSGVNHRLKKIIALAETYESF